MKTTAYYRAIRRRPDRAIILEAWVERVVAEPERREVQQDGRIRLWGRIAEFDRRALRVVLLADGETVHNAFFDRGYSP